MEFVLQHTISIRKVKEVTKVGQNQLITASSSTKNNYQNIITTKNNYVRRFRAKITQGKNVGHSDKFYRISCEKNDTLNRRYQLNSINNGIFYQN